MCEKNKKYTYNNLARYFGFQMNQTQEINGKYLYGPSLCLKGITKSQIYDGHAFSFNLGVEVENKEARQVPMICQVFDEVDESADDFNLVEYIIVLVIYQVWKAVN